MKKINKDQCLVSFIIPAYNEKEYLKNCLQSISKVSLDRLYKYEIIVIDNGSTDNTFEIAKQFADKVLVRNRAFVSVARNEGVLRSQGELIVFLDADVRLTNSWGDALEKNMQTILTKNIITGARYVVREDPSWLEANWFKPLSNKKIDYINGGNILLSRVIFDKIGGFDELLETGEDYELSVRAKNKCIGVEVNPEFIAIHDGYPSTVKIFFQREAWHGKGDFLNIKTFVRSKVAVTAIMFGILHVIFFVLLANNCTVISASTLFMIVMIVLLMSYKIFNSSGILQVIKNSPLCYLYLLARFYSLKKVLFENN